MHTHTLQKCQATMLQSQPSTCHSIGVWLPQVACNTLIHAQPACCGQSMHNIHSCMHACFKTICPTQLLAAMLQQSTASETATPKPRPCAVNPHIIFKIQKPWPTAITVSTCESTLFQASHLSHIIMLQVSCNCPQSKGVSQNHTADEAGVLFSSCPNRNMNKVCVHAAGLAPPLADGNPGVEHSSGPGSGSVLIQATYVHAPLSSVHVCGQHCTVETMPHAPYSAPLPVVAAGHPL